MVWVAAMDKPSTLASSCRQGRGLDANRVTVMVVLATRRRLAPCGSSGCVCACSCDRMPHVSNDSMQQ